jgi:hypothetical protein
VNAIGGQIGKATGDFARTAPGRASVRDDVESLLILSLPWN